MKSLITFYRSGQNSVSGKVVIPPAFLEILGIDKNASKQDRYVDVKLIDNKIVIEKIEKNNIK